MLGFVPGRAFQRPSAETTSPIFVMLLGGDPMLFESEQPVSNDSINMKEAIFINIFSPITP
jgi:hypothetical protein